MAFFVTLRSINTVTAVAIMIANRNITTTNTEHEREREHEYHNHEHGTRNVTPRTVLKHGSWSYVYFGRDLGGLVCFV